MLRGVVEDCKIQPATTPITVTLECFATRPKSTKLAFPRPDVDNFAKSVLDGSNGILWVDDSLIVDLTVSKAWANPKCPGYLTLQILRSSGTSRARRVDLETT
jgi:Holliday junction resolvase RusA-like endonuclease